MKFAFYASCKDNIRQFFGPFDSFEEMDKNIFNLMELEEYEWARDELGVESVEWIKESLNIKIFVLSDINFHFDFKKLHDKWLKKYVNKE